VLFGATGYTGRLTAEALAAAGARPVLAGRDRTRLQAVAGRLGGLPVAEADTSRPDSVRALVGAGEVLVSTVGPFLTRGEPAVRAAVAAGATYLDSSGEPPFLRRVFEEIGPRAEGRCALVPAFGYDFVPGNLAGALALSEAPGATRVTVGYFAAGPGGFSSGTLASGAGLLLEPGFAWRGGRLRRERTARRVRSFRVGGRDRLAVSYAGSEHYTLPRLTPALREVDVYLGWFGRRSRALQAVSAVGAPLARVPGVRPLTRVATGPLARRTGQGPTEATRRAGRSLVVAIATDEGGRDLARVDLHGPDPYTLTARLLAWAATRAASNGLQGTGALGPVEAFGLASLQAGAATAGLERTDS